MLSDQENEPAPIVEQNDKGKPCLSCRHREELIFKDGNGKPFKICANCMMKKDE